MRKILLSLILGMAFTGLSAQVSLTATGGTTTATYVSLKNAFDAINAGAHTGSITLNITANTTETATAELQASGGTSNYTSVLIKPAASVSATISGNVASGPVLRFFGSNITIDGSNTANGTTRNLIFTNTATTSPQVIAFTATAAASANTNITVKNSNIVNGSSTSSALVFIDAAATPVGSYFSNVTIQNNAIKKAYIGLYMFAATAAGNGNNTLITGNDLSASGTDAIRLAGIYVQGATGATVSNNTIGNFDPTNAEIRRGIWFATSTVNSSITNNTITNLNYTGAGAGGAAGITVSSGNTGISAAANIIVRSNTISNFTSSGNAATFSGVVLTGATSNVTIDRNKISAISNTNTTGYGANGILISSTSTAANVLVANNIVSGISGYGYATAGGLNDNGNGIVISAGAGYKIYHNTVVMNVNQIVAGRPAAFNVTSGVTAANAIDVRNNIFVNTQTQTGDRYAIYSGAASTVFSNINNNNYFSLGTALGFIGTPRTLLADLQAGFGGNLTSYAILPVFLSATDFHLSALLNVSLDNKGVPLPEVTVDADAVVRSTTTPDLGAFEFSLNLATQENSSGAKFSVYPNPVVESLTVSHTEKMMSAEVYNMSGQRILTQKIDNVKASINMAQLPAGVYLVKINTANDSQTAKVIKK